MTKIVLTNREKLELAALELGLKIVDYSADKWPMQFTRDDGPICGGWQAAASRPRTSRRGATSGT